MSTAVITQTSTALMPFPLTPRQVTSQKLRRRRVDPRNPVEGIDYKYSGIKKQAEGGLLLFQLPGSDNLFAFYEDAKIVGRVLGVSPLSAYPGGPVQIILTARHIKRTMRLLRADGNQDIYIATEKGAAKPADHIGATNAFTRDHVEALD